VNEDVDRIFSLRIEIPVLSKTSLSKFINASSRVNTSLTT